MKMLHMVSFMLLVVGGLNWGLAAFNYNVVDMVLGVGSVASKIVYVLVALSAVYVAAMHKGDCKTCSVGMSAPEQKMM